MTLSPVLLSSIIFRYDLNDNKAFTQFYQETTNTIIEFAHTFNSCTRLLYLAPKHSGFNTLPNRARTCSVSDHLNKVMNLVKLKGKVKL